MPVKYWSFAGLILTSWCNARCASCYLCCGPDHHDQMSVEFALDVWRGLIQASPHGCRIHLTGGEPFGNWPGLIELCRRACQEGLAPLEKIETNAFWATDEGIVRNRLGQLDAAGMGKFVISADPYHQQFVPIDRCRLAARIATEMLGADRVRVRWRDWLREGFDTADMEPDRRAELFARYAARGRDRLNGRAADLLGPLLPRKGATEFADSSCSAALLRSKHVHVDPGGWIMPGVCAGIVLGRVGPCGIAEAWSRLNADYAARTIVGPLAVSGPVGLLERAESAGFVPQGSYAGKCHLCWDIRRFLVLRGMGGDELGPRRMYQQAEYIARLK